MNIELQEIRSFLANKHPFDLLSEKTLSDLPEKLQIRYFRKGSEIPDTETLFDHLYLIRTGEVELKTADGEQQARLGEDDMFGYGSSHVGSRDKLKAFAMADTLVYQLRAADLYRICDQNAQFNGFFEFRRIWHDRGLNGITRLHLSAQCQNAIPAHNERIDLKTGNCRNLDCQTPEIDQHLYQSITVTGRFCAQFQ